MRFFYQILFLFCLGNYGISQENFNLELVTNVTVGESTSDIWGYVDEDGTEYAIMGTRTTTKIWSLEDPANPIERASIDGVASIWRDIKSFEDHLYVTTDQGQDGLLIIDMSKAPDTITHNYWKPDLTIDGETERLEKCHNLYIDTDQGYCYLAGCNNGVGGVMIFDLNQDKDLPVHTGTADLQYSHDVYVKNDKMYASEIYLGMFTVYDVSDKSNPTVINGDFTSTLFTHNAWLSDDEKYLFTTDERPNAYVDAFDVSDLDDIKFLDKFQPIETKNTGLIPHNTHYMDGFLITSWYTDGIVITDVNKPDNMIKVGAYDTETDFTEGFEGCWGAYPWLPSGLLLGSDINHGLFIFRPVIGDTGEVGYQRACYLEGKVTDNMTGASIPGVVVKILSPDVNEDQTSLSGDYKTGQSTPGTFDVEFTHPNYDTVTAPATLVNGEVTILDIQMGNSLITGTVVSKSSGEPIENAKVVIENVVDKTRIEVSTDIDGIWMTGTRANQEYNVYAAAWGYKGASTEILFEEGEVIDFELEDGYEDDFFADLGWTDSGDASSGHFEIGDPNQIFTGNVLTQTSEDVPYDIGNTYMVTGASGSTGGENDVDDGAANITSPAMDFSGMDFIDMTFSLRHANTGGSGEPNDFTSMVLENGIGGSVELVKFEGETLIEWDSFEVSIAKEEIEFTADMTVTLSAVDISPGHVLEVGLDAFEAEGRTVLSTLDEINVGLSLYPNPVMNNATISHNDLFDGDNTVMITDVNGKIVYTAPYKTDNLQIEQLAKGLYNLQIIGEKNKSENIRFIKM